MMTTRADGDLYYRSFEDLNRLVRTSAARLPSDIDVVVGIPRSGLLVANLLALHLHVPLADVDGFANGRVLDSGRRLAGRSGSPLAKALVVDDSVTSGAQLAAAREKLSGLGVPLSYAVAYAAPEALHLVDFAFEVLPQPRVFEWNVLSSEVLTDACVDIDGVLCRDPTDEENDDGEAYRRFIADVPVRFRPRHRIKHLVTSRLERYRAETEQWLARHGIGYERLWMAPFATAAERRAARAYAALKADVYRETGARLFIESSDGVAGEIAELTGRPVFCTDTRHMIYPGMPPGAIMTFPGRTPPRLDVPLGWFIRQASVETARRVMSRLRAALAQRTGAQVAPAGARHAKRTSSPTPFTST